MTTTPVGNGQTVNNQDVTSGNTLDVQAGGTADTTTVESGGAQTIEAGGAENGAVIRGGGTETLTGTINSSNAVTSAATGSGDDDFGTINVSSGGSISNVTVENGGSLNLVLKTASANGAIVKTGGALTINGNAPANNVTLQGGLLDLQSPKADSVNTTTGQPTASGTLTFGSGSASRLQLDVGQTGTNGTTFSQTITGFAAGDIINLESITGGTIATTTTNGNTTLTVTGTGTSGSETFTFIDTPASAFATATDANGGTNIVAAVCFVAGTLIETTRGAVAIEHLAIGDLVVTDSGAHRPVLWLGHRTMECRHHPRPHEVMPVRIAAQAFGENKPARDLLVSPAHAICVDVGGSVLIPAGALVNGTSVRQIETATVTYWHVQLDAHDVILAEGLPAESYIEMGNRGFFVEAEATVLRGASPDATIAAGHAEFCRPFHQDGPLVEAVRARLGRATNEPSRAVSKTA